VKLVADSGGAATATTDPSGAFDALLRGDGWSLGSLASASVSIDDGGARLEVFSGVVRLEQDLVIAAPELLTLRGTVLSNFDLSGVDVSVRLFEPARRARELPREIAAAAVDATGWFETRAVVHEPTDGLWALVSLDDLRVPVQVPLSLLRSEHGAEVGAYVSTLRVRVSDETGLALEGAEVRAAPVQAFEGSRAAQARTEGSGFVELVVPSGPLELAASAAGRRSYFERFDAVEDVHELAYELRPLESTDEVFGFVVLEGGDAASGATVTARPLDDAGDARDDGSAQSTADARGAFELQIAGNRELELVARLDGAGESLPMRAVPGREPRMLVLRPGASLEISLDSGAIPGPFRPGSVEVVALERRTRAVEKRTFDGPPFVLDVAAGEHEVYLLCPGLDACGEAFAVVAGGERANVFVPLREAFWISGVVRDAEHLVFVGLDVTAYASWPAEAAAILGRDRTDPSGRFRVFTSSPRCELDVTYAGEVQARVNARARTELEIELP
jgi:hypothetical protein